MITSRIATNSTCGLFFVTLNLYAMKSISRSHSMKSLEGCGRIRTTISTFPTLELVGVRNSDGRNTYKQPFLERGRGLVLAGLLCKEPA